MTRSYRPSTKARKISSSTWKLCTLIHITFSNITSSVLLRKKGHVFLVQTHSVILLSHCMMTQEVVYKHDNNKFDKCENSSWLTQSQSTSFTSLCMQHSWLSQCYKTLVIIMCIQGTGAVALKRYSCNTVLNWESCMKRLKISNIPHQEATKVPSGHRYQIEMRSSFDFASSSPSLALETATQTERPT